jgi:hypothetical protein
MANATKPQVRVQIGPTEYLHLISGSHAIGYHTEDCEVKIELSPDITDGMLVEALARRMSPQSPYGPPRQWGRDPPQAREFLPIRNPKPGPGGTQQ